jgi:hypothetical protein
MSKSRRRTPVRNVNSITEKATAQKSETRRSALPASQPQKPDQVSSVGTFYHNLGKIVGLTRSAIPPFLTWAATVLTIISAAFLFLPRVTVDPSAAYDPSTPSPITFTVTNTNVIPLRDVHIGIGVCYLGPKEINPRPEHCNGPIVNSIFYRPQWFLHWLDVDEKSQFAIEDMLGRSSNPKEQFEDADITVVIEYTPWHLPSWLFRQTRQFRFITTPRSDGKIYWTPVPLNR